MLAENCEMFLYLADSRGWKKKLMSFLPELLLPEASFPAREVMMSRHSTACIFDLQGPRLSLAPFLFWMGYLKRQASGVPGRCLECLIIRSSKEVSCGLFSEEGGRTKPSSHFLTCSTHDLGRKAVVLTAGIDKWVFFFFPVGINFWGLFFFFFQNGLLCFQV